MALRLTNTDESFGAVSIVLHWGMALMVFGLFALGLYMTGLEYTDPWYTSAPHIHKSFGLLLFAFAVFRLGWRLGNPTPGMVRMPVWESGTALFVHWLLYSLLLCLPISGYLISTADGRGIELFNWFTVPSLLSGIDAQEDIAGAIHLYLAFFIILVSGLHTAAALKHHFINKDSTLLRMIRIRR